MSWMFRRVSILIALALAACADDVPAGVDAAVAVPVALPAPTGPHAVGAVALGAFYTTAYYPAHAGTGRGPRPYASASLVRTLGIPALAVTVHAEVGAAPVTDAGPWPVVVFTPGGGSYVELSTALAEDLASHGYVVVLVQPDAEAERGETQGAPPTDPAAIDRETEAARLARLRLVTGALDLVAEPLTAALVGPIDATRIAVGGHSYGGSTAFNASLVDPRVKAAFDLDGSLFEAAGTTPVTVPSLVVMASMYPFVERTPTGAEPPDLARVFATLALLRRAEHTVVVALEDADHYDVTDAAAIAAALPPDAQGGAIGPAGTTHTATIVVRFLDAALAASPRLPAAAELVEGLPRATTVAL